MVVTDGDVVVVAFAVVGVVTGVAVVDVTG